MSSRHINIVTTAVSLLTLAATLMSAPSAKAQTFTDNFDSVPNGQPDPLWNSAFGGWTVINGAYKVGTPSVTPPAITLIAGQTFGDFIADFDILGSQDGGIVFRALDQNNSLQFNVKTSGGGVAYFNSLVGGVFQNNFVQNNPLNVAAGANLHVKLTVTGNFFSARVTGSGTDTTVSASSTAYSAAGKAGLYSNGNSERFDNFTISGNPATAVPETSSVLLIGSAIIATSVIALGFRRYRPSHN